MSETSNHPPRTVAWLLGGGEGGGIRRCVLTLAAALAERGWRPVAVSLTRGGMAEAWAEAGWPIIASELGPPPHFAGPLWAKPRELMVASRYRTRAAPLVAGAVKELGADVLHVVTPNLVPLAGRAAKLAGRLPCFWEMPNVIGSRYPLGLNRRLYQWALWRGGIRPLANSAHTAATLGDWPVRPKLFYLGADARRFDPSRVEPVSREALGLPAGAPVFGIFARLSAAKGQLLFLQSMLRLPATPNPPHLVLAGGVAAGSEGYAGRIQQVAADAGAAGRLHLLGEVSEVERYWPAVDVAVNPSTIPEGFGLSIVEAMMMGRPVLAHASGGPAETVLDGETGWLMPGVADADFDAALGRVMADRGRWRAMGAAGRARAMREFTAESQAARYIESVEARLAKAPAKEPISR